MKWIYLLLGISDAPIEILLTDSDFRFDDSDFLSKNYN